MSNIKISQLPQGSTPLLGTEQIPMVQVGQTVKVAVSGLFYNADLSNALNVPVGSAIGTLAVSHGGTSASDKTSAFNNLAPNQSTVAEVSTAGQVLTSDGENISWADVPNAIPVTVSTQKVNDIGLTISGQEIGLSGLIDLTILTPVTGSDAPNLLPVVNGGVPYALGTSNGYVLTVNNGSYLWDAPASGGVPSAVGVTDGWVLTANADAYSWEESGSGSNIGTQLTNIQYVPYGSGGVGTTAYSGCIAIGVGALAKNESGQNCIGIGTNALGSIVSTTNEIAIGNNALSGVSGGQNLAIGDYAGSVYTGAYSVFLGSNAGASLVTGNGNVCIGTYSGSSLTDGFSNVFIGTAGANVNGCGSAWVSGSWNVVIGGFTGSDSTIDFTDSSGILVISDGHSAAGDITDTSRLFQVIDNSNNVYIGQDNSYSNLGTTPVSNNTIIGTGSCSSITSANYFTTLGSNSGNLITVGSYSLFVGYGSGSALTKSYSNVIIGGFNGISTSESYPLDMTNLSNCLALADGDGHVKAFYDAAGNCYIGCPPDTTNTFPGVRLGVLGSIISRSPAGFTSTFDTLTSVPTSWNRVISFSVNGVSCGGIDVQISSTDPTKGSVRIQSTASTVAPDSAISVISTDPQASGLFLDIQNDIDDIKKTVSSNYVSTKSSTDNVVALIGNAQAEVLKVRKRMDDTDVQIRGLAASRSQPDPNVINRISKLETLMGKVIDVLNKHGIPVNT